MQVQFDKQYPVYAFDTACFYTEQEVELDRKLNELRYCLKEKESLTPEKKSEITKAIGKTKEHLKNLIDDNVGLVREVRSEALKDSNVVQVFESTLVRCLGMKSEEINDAMVIVKVYYFGVAESIIKNGFNMNGKHYVFFSASAGQIRTKKFVAIREDLLSACMNTLTCGLTIDGINSQGGVNINKYLAYLALSNSATEEWTDFDIDKCIVIDDFETNVCSVVDFINEKDYSITREVHDVPITHTDGCGMISFDLSKKNFMVRAPWVKGLLSPFPFERYIKEANERDPSKNHGIVKDVYGQEHDILAEGIKIIFCKSQFKMYKYFKDWNTYKENFKKYHCSAGKCNVEPDVIKRATINYQMLQTLTTLTDDELTKICSKTNSVLSRISTDKNTMLRCMGVDEDNHHMNSLQKCLLMYPELLQDEHCKDQLREMRKSILKEARAGKLMVDGKYQFLIPDLYAACQHWFDGIEVPQGLLENGEVWTRQYQKVDKLDVLRSPHLYKEHAVRNNVWSKKPEIRQWFKTDGIYTSTFDCISKILQFDVDGDKALVVAEPTLVAAADRECEYIVPLYYPMAKAEPAQIDSTALFNGMVAAWTGGNIGVISNHITKIWQMDKPDEDAVKILCMENNFVI